MTIKNLPSSALDVLRGGFVRFAPFNIFAFIGAICIIWYNHAPPSEAGTLGFSGSVVAGTCWGMFFALATRLAVERRECRTTLKNVLPAVVGVAMAVLGACFWHHMQETSGRYTLWAMLYSGGFVSVVSFAVAQMFGKRNAWTVFGRLFLVVVFALLVSMVAFLGSMLCIAAYDVLIAKVGGAVYGDVAILVWCAMNPVFMAAMLPKYDEPTEHPRAFTVLFWFIVPIGIALLAILYAYIAKIVFAWSMPSGTMNWFASCALAGYLFLWLSLRGSRVRFFASLARWGWAALLPVIATQIVGIAIRYNAYGLTTSRMAGMAALAIGIYALALAALDLSGRSAFIVLAVAALVLTVSPFNILDVPIHQQSARLRAALERAGCFVDGRFTVPEKPNVSEEDAKIIDGAWQYLTEGDRPAFVSVIEGGNPDPLHLRQGVWNRNEFTRDIAEAVQKLSGQKQPDLPGLLKIKPAKVDERTWTLPDSRTTNLFILGKGSGALDISGYAKFETVSPLFDYENGRYFVTLSQSTPGDRIDVTAHVKKLLANSGAAVGNSDGEYHQYILRAEDAVWKLTPDLAFLVTNLTLYDLPEGRRTGLSLRGYILRK